MTNQIAFHILDDGRFRYLSIIKSPQGAFFRAGPIIFALDRKDPKKKVKSWVILKSWTGKVILDLETVSRLEPIIFAVWNNDESLESHIRTLKTKVKSWVMIMRWTGKQKGAPKNGVIYQILDVFGTVVSVSPPIRGRQFHLGH